MKSVSLLATVALASLSSAHPGPAMPKLMGGREFLQTIKGRNAMPAPIANLVHVEERTPEVGPRAEDPNTCGPGVGSCVNACCSPEGYCGTTEEYCAAPDCQFEYGPLCDTLQAPSGASTANIARPHIGDVPYGGAGVYDCQVAGDIAFTFDDGPYLYTNDLLDKLAAYGAKATFMITGNNLGKGAIDTTPEYVTVIKRMIAEGHQVASHTWGHQNLTSLDPTTFKNQMYYNEMAFRNILGYFPTYMRPPYSECNDTCGDLMADLGYHVTYFDLDTEGYLNDAANLIQKSKNIWDAAIATANPATDNYLEIEHDIHYQTVYNLTDYILASMYSHGFKSVTVGNCLGDPSENWYRSGDPNAAVPTPSQQVSDDGSCNADITCLGSIYGNCCSINGFCGSTDAYCGTGCQPGSGTCSGSSTTSTSTAKASTSTAKASTSTAKASTSTTKTSTSAQSTSTQKVSTDGSCSSSITCIGSSYGDCCSEHGYCGSTIGYCGTGCQPIAGTCSASTTSTKKITSTTTTSTAVATSTLKGSSYGNCCSTHGYCGSTTAYCGTGCQKGFGTCT
ncbi:hypothetical protein SS1G_00642 [Sclerotinia sclerotiorum 1980 UF-70]|uniref:Carbohydrate esterase family 4 protein n=1 Tax=Sclerotinia sclerotiorum (strain ATCC 18683 / 1980 / Ss-1) TaxID=665079 RepID=A7E5R7_SCLS1|nr:hypothetical protein SS1G_00642 [Sclerotinia sclerotiorum 1980 UF-70]EDN91239.1 hypothetical protein SS1G_00642 [Sclerotinia sclerotiorum 1980 UF-70]